MRFVLVTKRRHSGRDVLIDRFGRAFHLASQLGARGNEGLVLAVDHARSSRVAFSEDNVRFESVSLVSGVMGDVRRAYRLAREIEPDVVIGSGDIPHGQLAALLAGNEKPFVYDLLDNYESFRSARLPGARLLHRRLIENADMVICVSLALEDHVSSLSSRTVVVGNGVDPARFHPVPQESARDKFGIDHDALVVGYVGGIANNRGLESLLAAVELGRQRDHDLRLVLAGPNESNLLLDALGVTYLGVVDHDQVSTVISTFDVAVWPYLPTEWGRYVHPYKLAEYLACGVLVAATDIPEFREVAPYDGIAWFRPDDPEDLLRALLDQIGQDVGSQLPPDLTWASQAARLAAALEGLEEF